MKPYERIIFALDVPSGQDARRLVVPLLGHVGAFKVGLELFLAEGPTFVRELTQSAPVMLDLKLHDIPETVERAIERAGDLGVSFVTLHVQQRATLSGAAQAANKVGLQLLAVTLLTSMSAQDCEDLRYSQATPALRVHSLANFAWLVGIRGFVTSPLETSLLRKVLPNDAILVVPGIRPAGTAADDQKRIGTPAEAIRSGADYLVIGRPIRDAADPVAAADAIAKEIEGVS